MKTTTIIIIIALTLTLATTITTAAVIKTKQENTRASTRTNTPTVKYASTWKQLRQLLTDGGVNVSIASTTKESRVVARCIPVAADDLSTYSGSFLSRDGMHPGAKPMSGGVGAEEWGLGIFVGISAVVSVLALVTIGLSAEIGGKYDICDGPDEDALFDDDPYDHGLDVIAGPSWC